MSNSLLSLRIVFSLLVIVLPQASAEELFVDFTGESKNAEKKAKTADEDVVGLIDPLLRLNRFNFNNTVLEPSTREIPHWIVFFCPPWFEPCQFAEPVVQAQAMHWEEKLNTGLFGKEVRFAAVDCATEKALCNTQNVASYPFIAHYHHEKQISTWWGQSYKNDVQRFKDWLRKELGSDGQPAKTKQSTADAWEFDPLPEWMRYVVHCLLIGAAIWGNARIVRRLIAAVDPSTTASPDEKKTTSGSMSPATASTPSSQMPCKAQTAGVARCFPSEWARDRPSLEL